MPKFFLIIFLSTFFCDVGFYTAVKGLFFFLLLLFNDTCIGFCCNKQQIFFQSLFKESLQLFLCATQKGRHCKGRSKNKEKKSPKPTLPPKVDDRNSTSRVLYYRFHCQEITAGDHLTSARLSELTDRFFADFLNSLYLSSHKRDMAYKRMENEEGQTYTIT